MCKFLEIAFTFFYARPRAFSAVTLKYVVHRITLFETFTRWLVFLKFLRCYICFLNSPPLLSARPLFYSSWIYSALFQASPHELTRGQWILLSDNLSYNFGSFLGVCIFFNTRTSTHALNAWYKRVFKSSGSHNSHLSSLRTSTRVQCCNTKDPLRPS